MHANKSLPAHLKHLFVVIKPLLRFPEIILEPLEVGHRPDIPKYHIPPHRPHMLIVDVTVSSQGVHLRSIYDNSRVAPDEQTLGPALLDDGDMRLVELGAVSEHLGVAADVQTLEEPGSCGDGHYDHGPAVEVSVLCRQLDDPSDELVVDPVRLQGCFGLALDVLDCDVLVGRLIDIWGMDKAQDSVARICGHVRPLFFILGVVIDRSGLGPR